MSAIDTIITDVRGVVRLIEPALAVIAVAQAAIGVGGDSAETAIKAIRAALRSFEDVAAGAVTEAQALASLDELRRGLASNDAAADAALEARFSGKESV